MTDEGYFARFFRRRSATDAKLPSGQYLIRLLYSVREPEKVFYRDELRTLSNQGDSVVMTYAYTRVTAKGWPRPAGRIDAPLIAAGTWPSTVQPTSYVCFRPHSLKHATDLLIAAGHDREKIRTERFGATGERK